MLRGHYKKDTDPLRMRADQLLLHETSHSNKAALENLNEVSGHPQKISQAVSLIAPRTKHRAQIPQLTAFLLILPAHSFRQSCLL